MSAQQGKMRCPFCGTYTARPYLAEVPYGDWFVKCDTCSNSMPPTDAMVHSEAEAIAAWLGAWAFKRIAELERECDQLLQHAATEPSGGV